MTGSVADAVVSLIARINRFVFACWAWLCGSVVALAAFVSLYEYRQDEQLTETNTVSNAPLKSDRLVTVLVPAWNEHEIVERSIDAFGDLSYSHRELVLCAGGEDDTYERALAASEGDDRVRVRRQTSDINKQAALNTCLDAARGDVLSLVDGDCVLDDGAWNAALRPVLEGEDTVVAGASRPLDAQRGKLLPSYQHVKEEYERARRPRYVRGLLGRNAVVDRAAIEELGGFDESIEAGTDYNLAKRLLRAGHAIRFVPNSRVQSTYPTTLRGYFSQQSRWLRNVFFLGREWGETDEARTTMVTCAVGAGMILAPLVGLAFLPVLLMWIGLVVYGVLTRIRWIRFFCRRNSRPVPSRVVVASVGLMFVEFAAWAYALVEIVVPSRRRKW